MIGIIAPSSDSIVTTGADEHRPPSAPGGLQHDDHHTDHQEALELQYLKSCGA
ncbi:MAG: hypothetical protein ACLVJ6_14200 [Merdibacter sp.]